MYACVEDHNRISGRRCLSQPVHGPALGTPVSPSCLPGCGTLCASHSTVPVCSVDCPEQWQPGFPLAALHLAVPGAAAESGESQEVVVTSAWGNSWVWMAENRQPQPEPLSVEANTSLEGVGLSPEQMG